MRISRKEQSVVLSVIAKIAKMRIGQFIDYCCFRKAIRSYSSVIILAASNISEKLHLRELWSDFPNFDFSRHLVKKAKKKETGKSKSFHHEP